jgi:hypothetical protein
MDSNGIMPVMNMGNDTMGGPFVWIFGLLILLGLLNGGLGGFGGNAAQQYATRDQVQNGFDTQNLQAQTRDILSAVTGGTAQTVAASTQNAANAINAIKDGNAALIREFGNVETALTALAGKQQECCCEILRAVDGVNYNNAINTAAINANTTAQTQKILDAIMGNRMADMQNQINALQLQAATANLLRFPNAWTYNGGVFPPATATA